jgi:hypothetical protein
MAKTAAVYLYGAGIALAAVLSFVFITANIHLVAKFGVLEVAYTFLPMLLLMVGVFRAQRAALKVVWWLIPTVMLAAGLLLFALLNHGFPDRALLLAVPHLAIAIPLGVYLLLRQSGRPPSNSTLHRTRA